jgi:hypothetical protein
LPIESSQEWISVFENLSPPDWRFMFAPSPGHPCLSCAVSMIMRLDMHVPLIKVETQMISNEKRFVRVIYSGFTIAEMNGAAPGQTTANESNRATFPLILP